jgi:hypothetical protein
VDIVAAPLVTVAEFNDVPLEKNVTVPVGITLPTSVIDAVRVRDWPETTGFADAPRVTCEAVAAGTVTPACPWMLPFVATMFALPCATPVARPELLIVITLVALDDQVTEDVQPAVVPSE